MTAVVGSLLAELAIDKTSLTDGLRAAGVDLTNFENRTVRQFQRVDRASSSSMGNIAKSAAGLSAALGKGLLAGITAAGLAGTVSSLTAMAKNIAEIGDNAKQAGLSTRSFQELGFVARQNRIAVDSLVAGVRELSLRGAEFFTTGGGSAAEAFAQLGYSAEEVRDKLRDPSQFLSEIIGKVQRLDKASRIFIFDQLFGGDGQRLVQLIDQGEAGIRRQIAAAHDLGIVWEDEVIARADDLDRKFAALSESVGTRLKRAIVEAADALQTFVDRFNDMDARRDATIDADLAAVGKQRIAVENEILRLRDLQRQGETYADDGVLGTGIGANTIEARIAELERENEALNAQEQMLIRVIKARQTEAELSKPRPETRGGPARYAPGTLDLPDTVSVVPERRIDPYFGAPDKASTAAVEDHTKAIRDLIEELEYELQLIGQSDRQKAISNALRQAGAAATREQRQQVAGLAASIFDLSAAQDEATKAIEETRTEIRSAASDFSSAIADALTNGEDIGKALMQSIAKSASRSLAKISDQALDKLFSMGLDALGLGGKSMSITANSVQLTSLNGAPI